MVGWDFVSFVCVINKYYGKKLYIVKSKKLEYFYFKLFSVTDFPLKKLCQKLFSNCPNCYAAWVPNFLFTVSVPFVLCRKPHNPTPLGIRSILLSWVTIRVLFIYIKKKCWPKQSVCLAVINPEGILVNTLIFLWSSSSSNGQKAVFSLEYLNQDITTYGH